MNLKFKYFKPALLISISQVYITAPEAQTFTKINSGPVVTTPGDSRSVNWVDINDDGLIDLFISNGKSGGQNNMLYVNNGGGNFSEVLSDTIVKDNKPSDGATFADCDNDGDPDAFVVNWYNQNNLFYVNDGTGTFSQTPVAPVVLSGGYSETASWGDYDNDGLLDLYVTRSGGTASTNKNLLFHNEGGNTFTKINTGDPVTDAFISRSVNWTDIDSDGDPDLFVTNEGNTNNNENIYRNDSNGIFTKITAGPLLNNGAYTMSSSWGDYDNDGDLDVFLANDQASNALFRNDGNFNFTKVIDTVSSTNDHSFSSAWSDIDNDGDIDLFVTNSFFTPDKQVNFLYLNNGNGSFTRVNNTPPAIDSSWSYGCAFGDYDNDGFQDLAVATVEFGGTDETDFLYQNDGNSNHFLTVKLTGTLSNKSAIGTKIRVRSVINGNTVWQMREISGQSSYCGQNDLRAHFGLGDALLADSVVVEWRSGTTEVYTNISSDQFITIMEGQGVTLTSMIDQKPDIRVFPNPTPGRIIITREYIEAGSVISISDSKGDEVYKRTVTDTPGDIVVELDDQAGKLPGVYYLSITCKSGKWFKRIIKL